MTIDELIDYVTHSPENTNPNVLRSMLGSQLSGGPALPEGANICMIIPYNEETGALEKTWQEITDILSENIICLTEKDNNILMLDTTQTDSSYIIITNNTQQIFTTNEPDGYPVSTPADLGPGSNPPTVIN